MEALHHLLYCTILEVRSYCLQRTSMICNWIKEASMLIEFKNESNTRGRFSIRVNPIILFRNGKQFVERQTSPFGFKYNFRKIKPL
ncbi:hypothetical protein DsansV1_C13g0126141 [Dioscorea sansibarensis]